MDQIEMIITLTCAAVFILVIIIISVCCCLLKRRTPAEKKMFVRLTQPRPSFCTLISNNSAYQRVLEEYEVKLMDSGQIDDFDAEFCNDQTKQTTNKSGKRKVSWGKETPRFPTSVEFPQWKVTKDKPRVRSHYNL